MGFEELVHRSRSYRRFDGSALIPRQTLLDLMELLRFTPSASNLQRLRYVLSCQPEMNARIYSTLGWAGSLPDWPGPEEPERPTAYVVIALDTTVRGQDVFASNDVGIVAQTLLLAATERGLGGCMFGSCRKKQLREILELPDHLEISLVVALGRPVERVVIDDVEPGQSLTYYREPDGTHHVPKLKRDELVLQVHA